MYSFIKCGHNTALSSQFRNRSPLNQYITWLSVSYLHLSSIHAHGGHNASVYISFCVYISYCMYISYCIYRIACTYRIVWEPTSWLYAAMRSFPMTPPHWYGGMYLPFCLYVYVFCRVESHNILGVLHPFQCKPATRLMMHVYIATFHSTCTQTAQSGVTGCWLICHSIR